MNLEQVADLAQVVGVVGLVASLVYVGQQLRLHRQQMEEEATSRFYEWVYAVFSGVAIDRDFAEVWMKGESELESLDPVDRRRAVNHDIGGLFMWAQWYSLSRKGLLPAHSIDALDSWLTSIGRRQSVREAWKLSKEGFEQSYREYAAPHLE